MTADPVATEGGPVSTVAEEVAAEGGPVSSVAEEVRRERLAQGLEPTITDPRALLLVARLVHDSEEAAA